MGASFDYRETFESAEATLARFWDGRSEGEHDRVERFRDRSGKPSSGSNDWFVIIIFYQEMFGTH
jgi:hypothetical protein